MRSIPWRVQLGIVAAAYAAVILLAAILVLARYMQYVNNPADAAAASGMYAGGDLILTLFIVCMFFVPTFLLVLVIRKSEPASTRYSQVLLGVSLTAPVCFALISPTLTVLFGWFAMYRLLISPPLIIVLLLSWLFARFPRAKRLILYALLLEAGSTAIFIAVLVAGWAHL
jgi:hypothetical protein